MYLLDTDYMSLIQRGTPEGRVILPRLINNNATPATTIITYEEQMRGWLDLLRNQRGFGHIPSLQTEDWL